MQKKKILFVEDDEDTRDILSIILEEDGQIESRGFAQIPAEKDLDGMQPDLILLDDWLPGKSGSEWCRELKSKECTAHIPVVLLSAVCDLETIAQKCHADGFITKPFDINHLKEVLDKTLRNNFCYK
jgi:DNA-binding response OmpR family regulator